MKQDTALYMQIPEDRMLICGTEKTSAGAYTSPLNDLHKIQQKQVQ